MFQAGAAEERQWWGLVRGIDEDDSSARDSSMPTAGVTWTSRSIPLVHSSMLDHVSHIPRYSSIGRCGLDIETKIAQEQP